jgi:hypothetical protein
MLDNVCHLREDCDSDLNVSLTPNIESKESINDVTICNELIVEQKQQLHDLLSDYSDILSDVPQVTNVIKHVVNTRTNDPIYKRPAWHWSRIKYCLAI